MSGTKNKYVATENLVEAGQLIDTDYICLEAITARVIERNYVSVT